MNVNIQVCKSDCNEFYEVYIHNFGNFNMQLIVSTESQYLANEIAENLTNALNMGLIKIS